MGLWRAGSSDGAAGVTALALKRIVRESLAEVGISFEYPYPYRSDTKARSTTWFEHERGFGLRLYPTGREVYIVQTRMAGPLRTITIAPSTIISQHQALTIARRVIAYAQVGHDPATDRDRIRSAPRFDISSTNIGGVDRRSGRRPLLRRTACTAGSISTMPSLASSSTS